MHVDAKGFERVSTLRERADWRLVADPGSMPRVETIVD